ncbi:MAG: N-acetyltransferase [Solirubrobacterales bacterium]|nr:N-acetyltransferase [Solirubrobacterales bacterium]
MSSAGAATVADNPQAQRYEVSLDGELAGVAQYRARPGLIAFTHTEVEDRFEGQGLASKLIAFALDDGRRRGLDVLPFCPFVNKYVQRHPEYADLVPERYRAAFGL